MTATGAWASRWSRHLARAAMIGLLAFLIFGPLANLLLWAFAERWYFPGKLPQEIGLKFWVQVFQPRGNAVQSLITSVAIALLTVAFCLAVAVPAGYALARLKLPWRGFILMLFLLPQAIPNLPIYVNIARMFYEVGLNGTVFGVVLVHASHGLVLAVWIASAAFAAVDESLEQAARNLGAGPWRCFATITLPLLMFNASMGGNYQIASITALLLLLPSIGFMLLVERFLKADVLAMVGR